MMIAWDKKLLDEYSPSRMSTHSPIDLWLGKTEELMITLTCSTDLLSEAERARAQRFKRQQDQDAFKLRRIWLRKILSRYLLIDPEQISYKEQDNLKPVLSTQDCDNKIYFNTSHCDQYFLIAISGSGRVGIDIEDYVEDQSLKLVAEAQFTEAEQGLLAGFAGEDWYLQFTKIWTRKEAMLKAVGKGLSWSLPQIETSEERSPNFLGDLALREEAKGTWFCRTVQTSPRSFMSIAQADISIRCNYYQISPLSTSK